MNTDTLTALGDIIGGVGVIFAPAGVVVSAPIGRQAARDGCEAAEEGRRSVELSQQVIEQALLAVAEARTARREEHLCRELERLERLAGLIKRVWVLVNRVATSADASTRPAVAPEMDLLLYDLRAVLMMFGQDEMPYCPRLAGHDGRRAIGTGAQIREATKRSRPPSPAAEQHCETWPDSGAGQDVGGGLAERSTVRSASSPGSCGGRTAWITTTASACRPSASAAQPCVGVGLLHGDLCGDLPVWSVRRHTVRKGAG